MSTQKKVYDGDFSVISTEKLDDFNREFVEHTKKCFEEFKELFGVSELKKLTFVLFDNLEEYRENYRERFNKEPPKYSRGNFSKDSAYISVEQEIIPKSDYFYKMRATGAHEAFHIYYRDLVYRNNNERIVWFDEGMAQFFSREKDFFDDARLKKYYLNFKKNYKSITNLNDRIQGNSMVSDDKIFTRPGVINGYPLSYLAIRYLSETKGKEYIKEIMGDNNKIRELGNSIVQDMIHYYDEKFKDKETEIYK